MEKVLGCEVFTVGYWLRLLGGSSNLPGQKSISTSQQLAKKPVYAPSPRVHLLGKVNSKTQKFQGCFKSGYMSKDLSCSSDLVSTRCRETRGKKLLPCFIQSCQPVPSFTAGREVDLSKLCISEHQVASHAEMLIVRAPG